MGENRHVAQKFAIALFDTPLREMNEAKIQERCVQRVQEAQQKTQLRRGRNEMERESAYTHYGAAEFT